MTDWKDDLETYLNDQKKTKKEIRQQKEELKQESKIFLHEKVLTAFEDLKKEFRKHKREVEVEKKKSWAAILVKQNKHKEFVYEINIHVDGGKLQASKCVYMPNEKGKLKLGVEGKIRNAGNSLLMDRISKHDIIADFLEDYKSATRVS